MILISHRGNIDGPNDKMENNPDYVISALKAGFEVEIDFWRIKNFFYLGHDYPQFLIKENFLYKKKLWIHAKNLEGLVYLNKTNYNYFWHENDSFTITSKGYIWTYPGKELSKYAICVLPERFKWKKTQCIGICSDFIENYK
jgi:hypothetical protein